MKKYYFVIIFVMLFYSIAYAAPSGKKVIDGVTIHNIEVGSLTAEEVNLRLAPSITKVLEQEVILVAPDGQKIWITDYKSIGFYIDTPKIINQVLTIGHEGSLLKQWRERIIAKTQGYNLPLELSLDRDIAMQEIEKLTVEVVKPHPRMPSF